MKTKALLLILAISLFLSAPCFADTPGSGGSVQKIKSEIANAVTDELVGKETVTTTTAETKPANLPPGLAKKGKVPPGWAKKTETTEVVQEQKPSLIQRWVKALFYKAEQATQNKTGEPVRQ